MRQLADGRPRSDWHRVAPCPGCDDPTGAASHLLEHLCHWPHSLPCRILSVGELHVRVSLTLKTDAPPAAEPEAEVLRPPGAVPRRAAAGDRQRSLKAAFKAVSRVVGSADAAAERATKESDYGGERGGG